MTEIDTEAIRERALREESANMMYRQVIALCDALDRQQEEKKAMADKHMEIFVELREQRDQQSKISESLALKLMKSQSQLSEIRAALTEQDDQWRNGLVRKIRSILGPE